MGTSLGSFNTQEIRPWNKPQLLNSKPIQLIPNISSPVGLTSLDFDKTRNIRVRSFIDYVAATTTNARVSINSWSDTIVYSAGVSWFQTKGHVARGVQTGTFNTQEVRPWNQPRLENSKLIKFAKPYDTPPIVAVWLTGFDFDKVNNWRIRVTAENVTTTGFVIKVATWFNTVLYSAEAAWLAHPADCATVATGSYNTQDVRPWNQPRINNQGSVKFKPGFFHCPPKVFAALNELDIGSVANMRLTSTTANVTDKGLVWNLNSWSDTILYSAGATYVAFSD